ncbi:MAG: hypothetical protein WAN36_03505 [Calditrichia bacterium]
MYRWSVLQNQFVVMALGGGLAIVLAMVLVYLAIWRPRRGDEVQHGFKGFLRSIPWVLIFTISTFLAYGVIQVIYHIFHPPTF